MIFQPIKITVYLVFAGMMAFVFPVQAQGFLDKLKQSIPQEVPKNIPGMGSSGSSSASGASGLSIGDISSGLKEALKVGSERVLGQIGATDGYNNDNNIHIPLPSQLQSVQSTLRRFGLSSLADDVELKLNRAAEAAAPKTKQILWDAVTKMTLDDAKAIYNGPQDAATQYFKRVASSDLMATIKPVVDSTLNQVGAIASYENMMGKYKSLPLVPDVKADLSNHTTDLALKGIFHYLAKEEAAIRQNPAKRTTELLTKVFGN